MVTAANEIADLMPAVVERLLGEPNRKLSKGDQLRFGAHGSLAVDVAKGVWHDHETNEGGGVLDFVGRETGKTNGAAMDWLRGEGLVADTAPKQPKIVASYDYRDESGKLISQVVRFAPKDFRQRKPNRRGGWEWKVKGIRRLPYRLPEVAKAIEAREPIYIVEGEKDADRLAGIGLTATCNAGGAGKWTGEHSKHLSGASVVLLPDNDETGRLHVEAVASSLRAAGAASVKIVELPGLPEKGDVSDWIDAGGDANKLSDIAASEAEVGARPPRRTLTWAADCRDSEPPRYVIKGVIAENNLFVAYGAPKATKSFAMLDAGYHIAIGKPWFNRSVKQGGVLIVCAERGAVMKRRLDALLRHHADTTSPPLAIIDGSFSLYSTPEDVQDIIDAANEVKRVAGSCRMIVLDTLAKANAGADDVSDMPKILGPIATIQGEFPEAAIVAIHHTNAEEGSRKMRGRSDLCGAIDGAQIENVNLGIDEDGEAFGSGVVVPTGEQVKRLNRKPLTGQGKAALQAFYEALTLYGENQTTRHFCDKKRGVTLEKWKGEFKARIAVDWTDCDKADATFRQACSRTLKALQDAEYIQVFDNVLYSLENDCDIVTGRDKPVTNQHARDCDIVTGTLVPVTDVTRASAEGEI